MTDGKPDFPSDWIAPGEFRFCACGWHLLPTGAVWCIACNAQTAADQALGIRIHDALISCRIEIANARKEAGVKPLFWMN